MKLERPRPAQWVLSAAPVWVQTSHRKMPPREKWRKILKRGPKSHSGKRLITIFFVWLFLQWEVNSTSHCCDTDRKNFIQLRRDCNGVLFMRERDTQKYHRLRLVFASSERTRHLLMSLLRKWPIWCKWNVCFRFTSEYVRWLRLFRLEWVGFVLMNSFI